MLTAGICHEIMNPLSGITGPLLIVERNVKEAGFDDEILSEGITHMKNNIDRISNIVNTMRTLFHGSSFSYTDINLLSIVNSIKDILKNKTGERVKFVIDIPEDFTIKSNQSALTQILMNLLSNAVESINFDIEGSVAIRILNGTELSIKDTGCGILKEDLDKIFDIAFTTKSKTGGTGIGLFIVKELSQRLGITIRFNSEIGIGTQVSLTFNS